MNILYIIGNGFDKNFGYRSTYAELYSSYKKIKDDDTDVIKSFKKSIITQKDLWSDFEMALPEYGAKLNNEDELLECIDDFQLFSMEYLLAEDARILSNFDYKKSTIIRNRMLCIENGLTPNERDKTIITNPNINVITFNYTTLIDEVVGTNNSVVHIHGGLSNRQGIFGVDSEEQLAKLPYKISERNKRGIIKPLYNHNYDYSRVKKAEELIATADIICIYGASMGESDLTWRNKLLEWITEDSKHILIVYDKTMFIEKNITPRAKLNLKDNMVDAICSSWGLVDEKCKPQIVFPYGFNVFNVNEIEEAYNKKPWNAFETGIVKPINT